MKVLSRRFFTEKNTVLLSISGRITIGQGDDELRNTIAEVLDKNVILDMSGVTTIDASGISELIGCRNMLVNRNRSLHLLNLPSRLNELLHVTRLIEVFWVFTDEAEAVARSGGNA